MQQHEQICPRSVASTKGFFAALAAEAFLAHV
jgi:hypothetical protein